jgi:hypothetical protein
MYAKTNPGAGRLTPHRRRILAVIAASVVVVLAGLGIWGALAPDTYAGSGHGCVTVTVASSTGGATLHYCGPAARSFCRMAFVSRDPISLRARPQCVLAGLAPVAGSPAAGSPAAGSPSASR